MADQVTQESCPVPVPTVVDPWPATVRNGQCAADGFSNHQQQQQQQQHQQQAKTPTEPESFTVNQEMKITDNVDGEGLLESSMRLKPHEAQDYRKKALWVSWVSIVVTLILAVAAFSKHLKHIYNFNRSMYGNRK
ncbi:transmembrane protein 163 [Fundulus heteroclitus]|uniref:transmembrane protein 163 n=1 Tax=Fundulus heteroclitus TaxID=8078 RepID=UPI00165C0529|nr:transmembrane protein 163 [Fundulus heteroclitus]